MLVEAVGRDTWGQAGGVGACPPEQCSSQRGGQCQPLWPHHCGERPRLPTGTPMMACPPHPPAQMTAAAGGTLTSRTPRNLHRRRSGLRAGRGQPKGSIGGGWGGYSETEGITLQAFSGHQSSTRDGGPTVGVLGWLETQH